MTETKTLDYWGEKWAEIDLPKVKLSRNKYRISNYGRCKRFDRALQQWVFQKTIKCKVRKVEYEYLSMTTYNEGKRGRLSLLIHRLVAEYFCPKDSPEQEFVIHLDHMPTNNYFENLKWVTLKELNAHNQLSPDVQNYYEYIRDNPNRVLPNATLNETQVVRLKLRLKRAGRTRLYKIAEEFGITHTQLNRIRKGENWKNVNIEDYTKSE